jgi:prevent-host-death family protein
MATTYNLYSLPASRELEDAPASDLKNKFKGVYQKVLQSGPVSITRNRRREAILLTAELYDQMIVELATRDPLKVLREEYDTRFAAMQTNEAHEAYERAFGATPEDLGKAAVDYAANRP